MATRKQRMCEGWDDVISFTLHRFKLVSENIDVLNIFSASSGNLKYL